MYIPLNNKSNYTLLSSLLKIDDIIDYAIYNKIPCISLCDTNMFGMMEFINKCKKNNIKPIVGLNVILDEFQLYLFVKNYDGYKNLIKLSTIQSERVVLIDDLKKYNDNIICVLSFNDKDKFDIVNEIYNEVFLGFSNKDEENILKGISKNVLFFRENLYIDSNDRKYLSYLYKIRDGKTVSDDTLYDVLNHELNINDISSFSSLDGIINTMKFCDLCNFELMKHHNLLPLYDCSDSYLYLTKLCMVGLNKRLNNNVSDKYKKRLEYELKIINDKGFCNYFLVVYDFIKFAKKSKILVGPGRGSAAGSLVAYSLGITDIDPLQYDLLFERFLNPERQTMPDIDTDFPDSKRDLVIDYVVNKYGNKRVSGIITFGTLGAKQVIRDVSRVLNIPLYKVDNLCKYILNPHDKLIDCYKKDVNFKNIIDSDNLLTKMYNISLRIEGFPRHTSHHAAGIIMSKIDLDEVVPLTYNDGMYLTSYSMEYLEDLGLLKMDFLGLKNLTLINNIIDDINSIYDKDISFSKIPLDDKDTISVFENANTCGIFQFESNGMRNFLKNLRPNSLEDLFAAIALFRPGPSINIDTYIKRKHGILDVNYLDPCLEPILNNTYGIFIYQEQIIQVANKFAGYSLGEADILRRAMSKKKFDLLKNEEEKFISKSINNGHSYEVSKKIFDLILNFAGYGFNKSHSVAYSIIAYKMAYLKCHYKTVFFSNLLTNVIGSESKTYEYIMEAKANNIEIVKPSINISDNKYLVLDNKIIYPFSNIKSIGLVTSSIILNARGNKKFESIYDCFSRLYLGGVGKKSFETLIYASVFSEFNYNIATLIYNLDALYNYCELTKDIDVSLVMKPVIVEKEEFDSNFLLEKEMELFGFYLSSHPITNYLRDNPCCIQINKISNYLSKKVDVLILVDKIKVINTKKGDKMAFITGSDETGKIEFTLFPKVYKQYLDIEVGNLLKVRGVVEKRYNDLQIVVEKIKYLRNDNNDKE